MSSFTGSAGHTPHPPGADPTSRWKPNTAGLDQDPPCTSGVASCPHHNSSGTFMSPFLQLLQWDDTISTHRTEYRRESRANVHMTPATHADRPSRRQREAHRSASPSGREQPSLRESGAATAVEETDTLILQVAATFVEMGGAQRLVCPRAEALARQD